MNMQNLTQKSIEAINKATLIARENGNGQITSLHLLKSLVEDENGLILGLLKKSNINAQEILSVTNEHINKLPKVSGGSGEYISADLTKVLTSAEKQAKDMKDEFISVEHLFYGLIDEPSKEIKEIFSKFNITKDGFFGFIDVSLFTIITS